MGTTDFSATGGTGAWQEWTHGRGGSEVLQLQVALEHGGVDPELGPLRMGAVVPVWGSGHHTGLSLVVLAIL